MKIYERIITILLILLMLFITYSLFFNENRNCLKEVAEDYCESKDLVYDGINIAPGMLFFCQVEDDAHDSKRFYFTLEELKSCQRIGLGRDKV